MIEQINKIKKNPKWYLIEEDNIYKAYIPKFPYKILFSIDKNKNIIIWAIAICIENPGIGSQEEAKLILQSCNL